jgi:hypothetical protein
MATWWDDIEILKALDRLEGEDRAYGMDGEQLLQEMTPSQTGPIENQGRLAFIRLLYQLRDDHRLNIDMKAYPNVAVPPPADQAHLQWMWHFRLTDQGRDRARGRLIQIGYPDQDEDDRRAVPGLILERCAQMIAAEYSSGQIRQFARDSGVWISDGISTADPQRYLHGFLMAHEQGSPDQRRTLRRFVGSYVTGRLDVVPTTSQRNDLLARLNRAGWHVKEDRIVIGDRMASPLPADGSAPSPRAADGSAADPNASIFLVHGRQHTRLLEVARFIERCTGREVVILHEQPNRGQTLIEKFEHNAARAAYAVVLLTADDIGRVSDEQPTKDRLRGRQNVVFELGFFFSQLGRKHVAVLIDPLVEKPSDIDGLVYIGFDTDWKLALIREFQAAGVPVDVSKAT